MSSRSNKGFPWLSLIILIATYGVAGWHYAEWSEGMIFQGQLWFWKVEPVIAAITFHGLAIIGIFVISSLVNTSFESLAIGLGGWLQSEAQAVMSIFFGALAFALIVQRLQYFARFLVLLASFLLFKLGLRTAGYSEVTSRIILICFSLGSFAGGVALFYYFP